MLYFVRISPRTVCKDIKNISHPPKIIPEKHNTPPIPPITLSLPTPPIVPIASFFCSFYITFDPLNYYIKMKKG